MREPHPSLTEQPTFTGGFFYGETSLGRPELAVRVLKEQGFSVHLTDVACIIVPNKPGGLYHALKILADNNINIDYMYAFAIQSTALAVIRSESISKVIEVLQKHKLELMKASQVYQL